MVAGIQLLNLVGLFIQLNKIVDQIILAVVVFELAVFERTLIRIFIIEEATWSISKVFIYLSHIHWLWSWVILVYSDNFVAHWSLNHLDIIFSDCLLSIWASQANFLSVPFLLVSKLNILVWIWFKFYLVFSVFLLATFLHELTSALLNWTSRWITVFKETIKIETCILISVWRIVVVNSRYWILISTRRKRGATNGLKIDNVIILVNCLFFVFTLDANCFRVTKLIVSFGRYPPWVFINHWKVRSRVSLTASSIKELTANEWA